MPKKQVKIYLEESFIQQLEAYAARYGRRSGNAVLEEIVARFVPVWVELEEEAMASFKNRVRQAEKRKAG